MGVNTQGKQGKSELSRAFGQLLLVLAGGLVGVLGNQFFFERNKKTEADLELKKQFLLEQLPIYYRIVNFTSFFIKSERSLTVKKTIYDRHFDQFGLIYARDTTIKFDTSYFEYPAFVTDTSDRRELYDDINIIKSNKDKIDTKVYRVFIDLVIFLESHPFPDPAEELALYRSDWVKKDIYSKWMDLTHALYLSANEKLNKGYD